MITINAATLPIEIISLVDKVSNGEEVIIVKENKPVAKISSLINMPAKRIIGASKGKIILTPDFDDNSDIFQDYI